MRIQTCVRFAIVALGILPAGRASAAPVPAPIPSEVAAGTWVLPGGMLKNREPDGNSVIFEAPAGLIVVDTGRHRWHRDAILSLARSRARTIVAIVNTHWHLDHVSGNPDLRAAFPQLRVYASGAIDNALTGFLASSAQQAPGLIADPQYPEELREDIRGDLLTIRNGAALKPDIVVTASGPMRLGGRVLGINLAPYAATSGDLWIYDDSTRVVVLGDLVTLPAPFLDTACPAGWKAALAQVAETRFELAIPGHGSPMSRAQFLVYQHAFEALIDCSASASPAAACAAQWTHGIEPLLAGDVREAKRATETAGYYIDLLRANGGRSQYCEAPRRVG